MAEKYQSFFEQTLHEWSEADESLYTQFVEYIVKTEYGNRFEELSIPTLLKDKIDFIKELAQQAEVKIIDLFKLFMHKEVFKLFQIIGWSLKALHDLLEKGLHIYRDVQNVIAEYIHKTHIVQWTKGELEKLDVFLSQHPKTKRIVGIGVAALLVYIWISMSYSGDYKDDFDLSLVFLAATGHATLTSIFGTPAGTKLLILFVTGALTGLTFPWPGSNLAKFGFGVLFTLGRYFHTKITKGIDVKENYIERYQSYFDEDIKLPLEKGSHFKYGKFKNKDAIYDHHFINDKGDLVIVTDTGKEIGGMKIRLMTEELYLKDFKGHAATSDFTKDWVEIRRKIKGPGNKSSRIHSMKVNKKKDYIVFIFKSNPTYDTKAQSVDIKNMTMKGNVSSYTQEIKVEKIFSYLATKPNYNEAELTFAEVKEALNICPIRLSCNCPSFTFQGLSYYLTQLDGQIYDNNIAPKRWNKYHDKGTDVGFICKHLSLELNSIDFYLTNFSSMLNRYLKTGVK